MSALPSPRRFVTQLLNALPESPANNDDATANPLSALDDASRKQLLSLQVLFPNEFLPALDLLDRGLITRLVVDETRGKDAGSVESVQNSMTVSDATAHEQEPHADTPIPDAHPQPSAQSSIPYNTIFYVRSAQARSSRYSTSYDTTQSYEVRLLAWNCSCPAFAFAAYPNVHPDTTLDDTEGDGNGDLANFGGVSLGKDMPPVCKHLLACVLVERCKGLFGGYIVEKRVGVEEAAGWAAGWGDS